MTDQDGQRPVASSGVDELTAAETIEGWSNWVRERAAVRPVPGQIKTPDSIIADLENLKHLAAQNVMILREADKTKRAMKRALKRARLVALKGATGKDAETRALEADVACEAEWEAAENAEMAHDYAKTVAQLVYENKSSVQTQAKQVELTYQLAGTGRQP